MIRLRLLGSVDLKGSNGEELRSIIAQPKPMALLAYLAAATPSGYHRREQLLSIFWPDLDSSRGRRALSQALHVLRSDLGEGVISSRGVEELGLDSSMISADVHDFRAAIERNDWKAALDLYHGELLSGFLISGSPEFDQWLDRERSRLKSKAIDSAWHLAESDPSNAMRWGRRAMELDPYSEDGIRRLITLLDKSGNRSEAIRAYDDFRARIARDLESEPSKETRALADALRESPRQRKKPMQAAMRIEEPVAVPAEEPASVPVSSPKTHIRRYIAAGIVAAGIIAGVALVKGRDRPNAKLENGPTRLVIAEFQSAPADTALGRTVTEALRLDLSRSNLVKVMSDATLRDALALMMRDTMLRVTSDLAREVAVRENIPVVLAGDVRRTGDAFVLSAQLINASSGELLNGWRATARDSASILAAIDELSASVRKEAGESARSIKTSSPLLRVSTTSLSALRKEAMGMDAFYAEDYRRAVALLNEAVAEDSTFTDAYLMLSVMLANSWIHPSRAVDASVKAYRYRSKLRDAERYNVEFNYLATVKGDIPAAIDAAKNVAALDPQIVFWGRYSNMLAQQRRFREAELAALRGLQWEENPFLYVFLANARFRAGKIDEARRTVAYGLDKLPSSPLLIGLRVDMLAAIGQYSRADSLGHAVNVGNATLAALDMIVGKADEAKQHLLDVRRGNQSQGNFASAVNAWVSLARFELQVVHDTTRSIAIADSIPATDEWQKLYANERPYGLLAHFYVLAGKTDRAKSLLADHERNVPQDYRAREQWVVRRTRAMVRVADGDASQVDEIRSTYLTDPQPNAALADLAWAYQRLGRSTDAKKAAQAYLDELNPRRTEDDGYNLRLMREIVSGRPGR